MDLIVLLTRRAASMLHRHTEAMSRRLKGQTTLQSIIGRPGTARKPQSAQRSRSSPLSASGHAPSADKVATRAIDATSSEPIPKPGYHTCPVCKEAVEKDPSKFNLHLGEPDLPCTGAWLEKRLLKFFYDYQMLKREKIAQIVCPLEEKC
jgi:hypothetical protein